MTCETGVIGSGRRRSIRERGDPNAGKVMAGQETEERGLAGFRMRGTGESGGGRDDQESEESSSWKG